jgi:hypothetical protein
VRNFAIAIRSDCRASYLRAVTNVAVPLDSVRKRDENTEGI